MDEFDPEHGDTWNILNQPVTARRLRLFGPATQPGCTDPARHEVWCTHPPSTPMVAWATTDGCSGRLCQPCDTQYGVKTWPDLDERIPGPAAGLDALDLPWPVYRPCRCCNAQCAWLAPTCPYVSRS